MTGVIGSWEEGHRDRGPFSSRPVKGLSWIQNNMLPVSTNNQPTNQPINQPTDQPTNQPINQPTDQPTNQPTNAYM
ncbi:PREDICTED: plasma protease C1 inhibitor-like [Cercocebus atys]|uniref:plasma protease C1 inhibitor-like n=1 Tax=Cercocebus atys TaxID=9531 RepID=UPI0005F41715|nr:PREDICTED: plasma protease C1 inhibitor-like [Cercocebus atys]